MGGNASRTPRTNNRTIVPRPISAQPKTRRVKRVQKIDFFERLGSLNNFSNPTTCACSCSPSNSSQRINPSKMGTIRVSHHHQNGTGHPDRAVRFAIPHRRPAYPCHGVLMTSHLALRRIFRSASFDGWSALHKTAEHPLPAHSTRSLAPRGKRHPRRCGRRTSPS